MSYNLFKWIHICSYIAWLVAFAGSIIYATKVRSAKGVEKKRKFMRAERLITNIGAHLGAVGILISGMAMAWLPTGPQWGWFNLRLYPWLTVKQVIFLIVLVLIGFSIKRSRAFKEAINQDQDMTESIAPKWSSAYRFSLIIYMLVVINTFLGFSKPF